MADIDIPPAAIEAQQAYDAANAEAERLTALMPPSVAVAAGEASIPQELRDELEAARSRRLDALDTLRERKRELGGDDPLKAEAALRKAARSDGPPDAA